MAEDLRRFYRRYYLLTVLIPAYATAASHYGLAWLLLYLTGDAAAGLWWPRIITLIAYPAALFPLAGLSRHFAALGFQLTGVPGSRVKAGPGCMAKLKAALQKVHAELDFLAEMKPYTVDTGDAPFLGVSSNHPRRLWVSRGLLDRLDGDTLAGLLAHEIGHTAVRPPPALRFLALAAWLPAIVLAFLLRDFPWLYIAAALINTLIWLRIQLRITMEVERRADMVAAGLVGRPEYIRAFVEYYRRFGSGKLAGSQENVRRRLAGMGLAPEEISSLLEDTPPSSAD